jgi:hypothetical protein
MMRRAHPYNLLLPDNVPKQGLGQKISFPSRSLGTRRKNVRTVPGNPMKFGAYDFSRAAMVAAALDKDGARLGEELKATG